MTKQYIWLVRYGKTENPLVEYDGPYDSDIDPTEGIVHAESLADQISKASPETLPERIYCSPFLRTTHTASILGNKLSEKVNVEDGLYEYLTPSLHIDRSGVRTFPRSIDQLKHTFENIDASYEKSVQITGDMFPEDEAALITRSRNTLHGILKHAAGANIVIVAHAPCVQALAFVLEGADSVEKSKLEGWPLGGITRFSHDTSDISHWDMDFYGKTDHMPGEYKNGAGQWSLPCLRGK
jgi:broad specificity phosphatase PhoE